MESIRSLLELDTEEAALLPAREVMAVFNVALINAANPSLALNLATLGSLAESAAGQSISLTQG